MKKYQAFGADTPEESIREKEHKALARRAAAEGFVLLKNDGVLPLEGRSVMLYGPGSRMTVKGGSGSGDVRERHSVSIEEGLKNAGFSFPSTLWMDRFEAKYAADLNAWREGVQTMARKHTPITTMQMFIEIGEHPKPYPSCTPILADELSRKTDTAIYVLSRQAGEGADRKVEKGDYLLSDIETNSLKLLSEHYKKLVLVINCGGVIDLSILDEIRIDAVIYYAQGGMEGGNALADILCGKATPCGRLADTWGCHYSDYPCADSFGYLGGDLENEDYREGIYVGYRYFDSFGIKPRYPFGYGLSYTEFQHKLTNITADGSEISLNVSVKNTGDKYSGKEVMQLYLSKPNGKYRHEKKGLCAFAKTGLLSPGQEERLTLYFDIDDLATFDGEINSFVLPRGEYGLYLGTDAENAEPCAILLMPEDRVVEEVTCISPAARDFLPLTPTYENIIYPDNLPRILLKCKQKVAKTVGKEEFSPKVKALLSTISDNEKISLVTGGGYSIKCYNNVMGAAGRTCTSLLKKGIPNIVLSDGPAGLNVVPNSAIALLDGTPRYPDGLPEDWRWGWLSGFEGLARHLPGKYRRVYRYMTAWPSETLLAQSWDISLLEEIGRAIGREMLEIGVSVWLAPGLNIHRNPLSGRNFEYYSEDPLISGKMAAAVTRGVQSMGGVGVSIKHFCCNNQEDNRTGVSANVSDRALREIYLRAFRIATEEGRPFTVMSSYNRVNGLHVCNNRLLLTDILRDEWGFCGVVMSDWNATDQCSRAEAVNSGNDLIMPGNSNVKKDLRRALKEGRLDRTALDRSAARVLDLVFKCACCKGF